MFYYPYNTDCLITGKSKEPINGSLSCHTEENFDILFYDIFVGLVSETGELKFYTKKDKTEQGMLRALQKEQTKVKDILFPHIDTNECTLDELKKWSIKEIGKECETIIYAGVEIETEKGKEPFSLTEKDQLNIAALASELQQGAKTVPYHANGKLCREFQIQEMAALAAAAKKHVTYHTTRCNHINVWVRRCTTKGEVAEIKYNTDLPEDLQISFNKIIGGAL